MPLHRGGRRRAVARQDRSLRWLRSHRPVAPAPRCAKRTATDPARSSATRTRLRCCRRQTRRAVRPGKAGALLSTDARAGHSRTPERRCRPRTEVRCPAPRSRSPTGTAAGETAPCAGSCRRACCPDPATTVPPVRRARPRCASSRDRREAGCAARTRGRPTYRRRRLSARRTVSEQRSSQRPWEHASMPVSHCGRKPLTTPLCASSPSPRRSSAGVADQPAPPDAGEHLSVGDGLQQSTAAWQTTTGSHRRRRPSRSDQVLQ